MEEREHKKGTKDKIITSSTSLEEDSQGPSTEKECCPDLFVLTLFKYRNFSHISLHFIVKFFFFKEEVELLKGRILGSRIPDILGKN